MQPAAPLLLAGLALALIYLPMTGAAPSWPRSVFKTIPLVVFTLAAYADSASPWLVAALAFSAAGDFALSRRGDAAFLYGLAAFSLAHVVYIILFLSLSGASLWEAFASLPLGALGLVAFGLSAEVWLVPFVGRLRLAVRLYVLAITLMGLAAFTLPLESLSI